MVFFEQLKFDPSR
jgi:hypothetical protein